MKSKSHLQNTDTIRRFCGVLGLLLLVVTLTVACNPSPGPAPTPSPSPLTDCINFEDLTVGSQYQVPTLFTSSGATIQVLPFQWGNMNWTNGSGASVGGDGLAEGRGAKEMLPNNVNLGFNTGSLAQCITLRFRDRGGNVNLIINNVIGNWNDFQNANLGGVAVSVNYDPGGQNKGTLTLHGDFAQFNFQDMGWISFAVGGQELAVDDVCPCP